MRHHLFLAMVLAFGLIGSIRIYSPDPYDGMPFVHVNVKNEFGSSMEDLKVRVFIYDLDTFLQTSSFDLGKGDKDGKFVFLEGNELKPGTYLARITVNNDKAREVKHRYITIG